MPRVVVPISLPIKLNREITKYIKKGVICLSQNIFATWPEMIFSLLKQKRAAGNTAVENILSSNLPRGILRNFADDSVIHQPFCVLCRNLIQTSDIRFLIR